MELKIEDIGALLRENGVKPSFQRLKIYEYLITYKNHPTVEMIYRALVKDIPTLSKTTVYNTLNLFVEKKIAIVIVIEENETRYDADVSMHGHFKCDGCLNIYDFRVEPEKMIIEDLAGSLITENHIYFKGTCKSCLSA